MPLPDQAITVSELWVYPIKSCAGLLLQKANFDQRGIVFDRTWSLVDDNNKVLTQRDLPEMALIKAEPRAKPGHPKEEVVLHLSAPGMPDLLVNQGPKEAPVYLQATVWNDQCRAVDQGDEAKSWFSQFLNKSCRLVKMHSDEKRSVGKAGAAYNNNTVGFQDVYPILIISEASLEKLNSHMDQPVAMNRFRPNIVVKGCKPYQEDDWRQIKIGALKLDLVEPCARCVVITIDQETAKKGAEPLKTLSRTRLKGNKTLFGQNAIHLNLENISIGERLEVLL